MTAFRAVSIVPASGSDHRRFVLTSFRECLRDWCGPHVTNVRAHVDELERDWRGRGQVVIVTPIGHPETFLGWAASSAGALVFAYVPQGLRGFGFASQLVASLFDVAPVRLVYWTDAAEKICEHGFPIVHDWREFARRQRFAERTPGPQQTERAA